MEMVRCWNCQGDFEVEDETRECPSCGELVFPVEAANAFGQAIAEDTM